MSSASSLATRPRVLFVDDDVELCQMAASSLKRHEFDVNWLTSGREAAEAIRDTDYDVLISDVMMEDLDGLRLCAQVGACCPNLPVVLITGHGTLDMAIQAIRAGAHDLVTKPFGSKELISAIKRVLRTSCPVHDGSAGVSHRPKRGFSDLIGASPPMVQLFRLLSRVGSSDVPLLITGESGTGKEAVARAVHRSSARADRPFVPINCAAVPETLLESQLFGHVRGAFTDAKQSQDGLLLQANGGTLFLDEIGDMPLALQPKLLRVLQDRAVRPLGGAAEIPLDLRIITATNQDLDVAIKERRFREDLFYRLNVVHIYLPPLRERGEDVLLLAQDALERVQAQLGKRIEGLTVRAARRLRAYSWPGNVRELQNCIQRAAALTRTAWIDEEDLPDRVRTCRPSSGTAQVKAEGIIPLEELENGYIRMVLEMTGGNKSLAAKMLGIDRATLYRKMARAQKRAKAERGLTRSRELQLSLKL